MATAQDGNDTWEQPQAGRDSRAGRGGRRAAWYAIGLTGSLVLLAAFYLVLQQSLARAEQHWTQAGRAEPCAGRGQVPGEACVPATVTGRAAAASPR